MAPRCCACGQFIVAGAQYVLVSVGIEDVDRAHPDCSDAPAGAVRVFGADPDETAAMLAAVVAIFAEVA